MKSLNDLTIRQVESLEECFQLVDLQQGVWGFSLLDTSPPDLLLLHRMYGGVVLAAFDQNGKAVAFCHSFHGLDEGDHIHWSHMLAVLPEYRGIGLGKILKWKQRDFILEQGVSLCRWTFDPLEGLNAHLNIVTLGATTHRYKVNIYGTSSGHLHGGSPTDRFVANWQLDTGRVKMAAAGNPVRLKRDPADIPLMLEVDDDGTFLRPGRADDSLTGDVIGCPVPTGMQELKVSNNELALEWRLVTRGLFMGYFARGYVLVDVMTPKECGRNYFIYLFRPLRDPEVRDEN